MRPAARCSWERCLSPFSANLTRRDFTRVISRIAVGGGVRGRQFGESATSRSCGFRDGVPGAH
jgi:hypothetical protein